MKFIDAELVEPGRPMTAVEWLEQGYDDWKIVSYVSGDGWLLTFVQARNRREIRGGPACDGSMIKIKDDLMAVRGLTSARDINERYWCWGCDPAEVNTHECQACEAPIAHMMGPYCESCWLDGDSGDDD